MTMGGIPSIFITQGLASWPAGVLSIVLLVNSYRRTLDGCAWVEQGSALMALAVWIPLNDPSVTCMAAGHHHSNATAAATSAARIGTRTTEDAAKNCAMQLSCITLDVYPSFALLSFLPCTVFSRPPSLATHHHGSDVTQAGRRRKHASY